MPCIAEFSEPESHPQPPALALATAVAAELKEAKNKNAFDLIMGAATASVRKMLGGDEKLVADFNVALSELLAI